MFIGSEMFLVILVMKILFLVFINSFGNYKFFYFKLMDNEGRFFVWKFVIFFYNNYL